MIRVIVWGILSFLVYYVCSQVVVVYVRYLRVGETYVFTSPNYDANYGANLNISWKIVAPIGNKVVINCPDVDIPPSTNCTQDVLSIKEKMFCSTGAIYRKNKSPEHIILVNLLTKTNNGKFNCTATTEPDPCSCGRRKLTKIVNGNEAIVNEFPFQAYLKDNSTGVLCSATIICNKYVMTAAHCVKNRQRETFNVVVGDHDTTTTADTNAMAVHSVEEIRIPTDYNDAKSKSDIALLRLTTPIEYNENVGPVCLPFSKRNATFVNETVTLAGWGSTEFGEPKSKTLQKVDVQTTDQQRCKTDFPNSDDTNICTYGEEKDSCQFDSGGSVYKTEPNGRVYSIGIISGGSGCAGSKAAINTRVTSQLDWITANIDCGVCNE